MKEQQHKKKRETLINEQTNITDSNMTHRKSKSRKDSKNALANMGANMSAMLSGISPLADSQSDNTDGAEMGSVEMTQSSAPDYPPVTDTTQDDPVQSAESAEYNGVTETETPSKQEEVSEKQPNTPVEVNIDIDKTQGNAIYSSLLGLQNTLDNYQLDVKQDSLREVVYQAIKDAVEEHLTKIQLLFELGKILYNNSLKKMPFQCNCLYISGLI